MTFKSIKALTVEQAKWVALYEDNRKKLDEEEDWLRAQRALTNPKDEASTLKEMKMSLIASDKGGTDFKQPPNGNHLARCYQIVDIGTQHGEYLGEPTSRQQIIIRWELPHETDVFDGVEKPLIVSKFYTMSLGEKANLRKDLEAWRSKAFTPAELKGFNVANVLGAVCLVSIIQNDKGKAKVTGVAAAPKGTVCPPAFNVPSIFSIDDWSDDKFEALPDGFKRLIEASDEYKAKFGKAKPKAPGDDFSTVGRRPDLENDDDVDSRPPF